MKRSPLLWLHNSLHDRNIKASFSESSVILENCRKMFGNVSLAFRRLLENLRKSLESVPKSSQNHQKAVISMFV